MYDVSFEEFKFHLKIWKIKKSYVSVDQRHVYEKIHLIPVKTINFD